MGWEWHNRERNRKGRFYGGDEKDRRLQIRCTYRQYEQIRGRSYARHMSISEYILDLVQRDMMRETYGIDIPANG